MSASHGARERLLIAVAVGLMSMLVVQRGLPAWLGWRTGTLSDAVTVTRAREFEEARLAMLPHTLDSLERAIDSFRRLKPSLLGAENLAAAEAELRDAMHIAAVLAEARSPRVEVHQATDSVGQLRRVRAQLDGVGDVATLAAVLQHVSGQTFRVRIDSLAVRPANVDSPADQPEIVRFSIHASALVLLTPIKGGK